MAGYSVHWRCRRCDAPQETMDHPQVQFCDRCDDVTRLPCMACGRPTTVTPAQVYRARGRRGAVHAGCVVVEHTRSAGAVAWDVVPI